MDQSWFEMTDVRRCQLTNSVWIPLRANQFIKSSGKLGYDGFEEEYLGAGSLAIPVDKKEFTENLGWSNVGIGHTHWPEFSDHTYVASDTYLDYQERFTGFHLVLAQRTNETELPEWHLHPDVAIALKLLREQDNWVCPQDGYEEVVRLRRDSNKEPVLIEMRSEYLRDYLCARKMALFVTSYRSRTEVMVEASHISWNENSLIDDKAHDRLRCGTHPIHEGGQPYGMKWAIIQETRSDVDYGEDVPIMGMPTEDNVAIKQTEKGFEGKKLFQVQGELWRDEWIDPADISPRIKHDPRPPTAFFITDSQGKLESRETLTGEGRWLWFRPSVMLALADRRGGSIGWSTRHTGGVRCSPGYGVHFGINALGLINVYAKDIGDLPDWQQQIWAAHNVGPDGGVSKELLAAQAEGQPVATRAPEAFLASGLWLLNTLGREKLGIVLLREHTILPDLLAKSHRFRAMDKNGLYALAKDLARLTADSFDGPAMQKVVSPPKDSQWRSLKSFENLLAKKIGSNPSRAIFGPLVGIYELRLADAHLPSSEIEGPYSLIGINPSLPFIHQGLQMLDACVSSLYKIAKVLTEWDSS